MAEARADARIITIDTIRGFAVCGILVMNIVSMGEPGYAYVDPNYYGGAHGADLAAWALAYVFADGKMRALFTMLFGASLLLITDAAEDRASGPARVHFARIFWLFAFGMLHAWCECAAASCAVEPGQAHGCSVSRVFVDVVALDALCTNVRGCKVWLRVKCVLTWIVSARVQGR